MLVPLSLESLVYHVSGAINLVATKGIPSTTTWIAYFMFFFMQLVLAGFMPGLTMYGLPTAPKGERLPYHCNGYSCYYLCIAIVVGLHVTGLFPLTYLADHYGECLVASIVIGDVTSVLWYIYGVIIDDEYNGKASRTGNVIYDFFMGSILYPRIGEIDIKMIAECRWSWLTLMIITMSCAAKVYESTGYINPSMAFMLLAHWLYSNATVKGEHCIPCTWDMFHENFGWMLNFWNVCGVPFMYCYQSLYIMKNRDTIGETVPTIMIVAAYVMLLVGYYVFDTANSQKANCKVKIVRGTFPQLPWAILEDPIRFIRTPKGDLLVDGWYAFGRKMQYTGDVMMALSWGLACGYGSLLPYFYFVFFSSFITHRQIRDEIRCKNKYGEHWDLYRKKIPNVFIPSSDFLVWLFTGKRPEHESDGITLVYTSNSKGLDAKKNK